MTPDRATLAVDLAERLRRRGVPADLAGVETLTRALGALPEVTPRALYWAARLALMHRVDDLAAFDAVFADLPVAEHDEPGVGLPVRREPTSGEYDGPPLPWVTPRARATGVPADSEGGHERLPARAPTALLAAEEAAFATLTPEQVAELGRWLEAAARRWPTRRSRRQRPDPRGQGVTLRATLARARRTGWEPVRPVGLRRVPKPRPVVTLLDVSRSMQAETTPLLHLMRALTVATGAEGFAFGTSLTRLTRVLAAPGPAEAAVAAAGARVADPFGGTRIAASLRDLIASPHEPRLGGAIVVICSDGWDSDAPDRLADAMARLRRRAHRVVWVNPRAGTPGFAPRVATLAAALPYCDDLLPAGSFADLRGVLDRVVAAGLRSR